MAIRRINPVGITATSQLQPEPVQAQAERLERRIRSADEARQSWIAKQRKLLEQRRGIRRKTNFPWPGAANDNWPISDQTIRRWKPGIIRLVLAARPVAFFFANTQDDIEPARTAQDYYDFKFRAIPRITRTIFTLVDNVAQYGTGYTRQGWDYRTDRVARTIRSESLFPGGPEQALQQFTAQAQQIAEEQGQPPPEIPPLEEFVSQVLQTEYGLTTDEDEEMLAEATARVIRGDPFIKIVYEEVVHDGPSCRAIDPLKVIRPVRSESGIENDEFVAIVHEMTREDILQKTRDGFFVEAAAAELLENMASTSRGDNDPLAQGASGSNELLSSHRFLVNQVLDTADGVNPTGQEGETREAIWEIFAKVDVNGDGFGERVVLWYHPKSKIVLSAIDYPFPFKEWPIVEFQFEHVNDRPYSARGIPEFLNAHQRVTNRMHNARLDSIALTLAPMYQVKSTAGQVLRNQRFRPGLILPVQNIGDIQPIVGDVRPLQFLLQEENLTRAQAEQYVGVFDASVLATGNAPERRTATEVQAVTGEADNIFGQDARLFQDSMTKVHRQLWQLLLEYGPDEDFFRVTGEEAPRLARKWEIDRNFDIAPAGTPTNTSKQLAIQNALQALQLALQDESGVLDRAAIYEHYLTLLDRNLAAVAVRSSEEIQLIQQLQQQLAEGEE